MATLAEINQRLRKTQIKGRDYVEVNQRILAFWELYPDGAIVCECTNDDGQRCDFVAKVYNGERLISTGHAFELRSAGVVNKTSYVENAETSAVGRALGFLGIGATESIASADEVANAIAQQSKSGKKSDEIKEAKARLWSAEKAYCERYAFEDVKQFHADMVASREDFNGNDAEAMNRIADELLEGVEYGN